ncbi:hypothetical protein [uncultured Hymenobacter sp.]|uniref:hypothetical protein n=1 Tax=uncultured Hymenobacter sp. TaxID=170016 RepID=UPI0035CB0081
MAANTNLTCRASGHLIIKNVMNMKKSKDKKKDVKKAKATKKTSLFGGAGKSIKKLGSGIGGLSTTQKVAGGAALVALGLSYLAKRRGNGSSSTATTNSADAAGAEQSLAAIDGGNI